MTGLYVQTNVPSLIARNQLKQNMADLGDILTRLSTGLRINSGKDDPAGLIASELLKSDMTATSKAIINTQRANSLLSIADSSLGQINNLLNDLKGLVVEAASEGTMSKSQIEANQLQIDATLDSIDRIAKTTNYLGKPILDGSMDFQTRGVDRNLIKDLKVYQANLGALAQMDVNIQVIETATKAQLFYDKSGISYDTVLEVAGNAGIDTFKFAAGSTVQDIATAINSVTDSTGVRAIVGDEATHGQIMLTSAGFDNDINLTALVAGSAAGNYTVKFTAGNTTETTYNITEPDGINPGIIEFKLKMEEQKAPSVENFDESFAGIHTYKIPTDRVDSSSNPIPLIIETKNNQLIRQVEYVKTSAASIAGGGRVAVNYDRANGKLQILYDGVANPTDAELETAINAIKDFKYISGGLDGTETGYVTVYDARPNNMLNIIATVPGLKFENTDIVFIKAENATDPVELEYFTQSQYSAATITHAGAYTEGGVIYDVVGRIVAKEKGAQYNDVKITFEHDEAAYNAGEVTAVYDEQTKILHVRGWIDSTNPSTNASYGAVKKAIEDTGLFTMSYKLSNSSGSRDGESVPLSVAVSSGLAAGTLGGMTQDASVVNNGYIYTGQVAGDIGTNNQTLVITVAEDAEVNDIIAAFNDPANKSIAANFVVSAAGDGSGVIFDSVLDADVAVKVYTEVLTGGDNGWETAVTAAELAAFINCDPVLGSMFEAAFPYGQTGNGKVTLFDEAAYYGNPDDETGLQFLGPKNSPDILFVVDGANSDLGISFEPSATQDYDVRPVAGLIAQNANAAFTVRANSAGDEFDNMAIRMIRLDDNYNTDANYARYISGVSNAMAYCSINDGADSGTVNETGKFIIYGVKGGEELNNVSIVTELDVNQTERVKVYYDDVRKKLTISVNSGAADVASGGVTLSEAVDAINATGIFRAEYDYSLNRKSVTDPAGPGIATFGNIFANGNVVEIGNTGNTGGKNGVLEIYLADEITGQAAVDAINSDPVLRADFYADVLGDGVGAGTGEIDFRNDNIRKVTGSNGQTANDVNMVTVQLGEPYDDLGYLVIHLATDSNGESITTARDLVDFMNSLTAEQTRGISVSLVRSAGIDNLNRKWVYDSCGNLIVTQECEDDWGKGIIESTVEVDDCDNIIYHPIEFYSYGEQLVAGYPLGNVVAVNGVNASFKVLSRQAGSELEGVGFRYVRLVGGDDVMWSEYDSVGREIVVYVRDNATANEIASVIETSEGTKDLFRIEQLGDGTGNIDLSDDYLVLRDGIYDAGYRGGARMLGAADNDPHRLIFESVEEGSSQKVSVRTVYGKFELRDVNGDIAEYATGTDTAATANGVKMRGDGRKILIDSSGVKFETVLSDAVLSGDKISFTISGGGVLFQVGPEVVTAQQLRIGIQSVSTATLGGVSGRLYQLRSGNNADLTTDNKLADKIIEEAIASISMLRGRLGATQRSTLEPTIASLQDNLVQITTAESQISNADFAEESSRLTRAQILVQAGARTLSIANQLPQYAASLLGG
ncbi:MAG: flagellin [Planctomycetaceae bacterium]|jgi:flagellin-like hook-associated protein FlgL|nr:flagellin [Planctomycetaceae bacterium]